MGLVYFIEYVCLSVGDIDWDIFLILFDDICVVLCLMTVLLCTYDVHGGMSQWQIFVIM